MKNIRFEKKERVGILTLSRPGSLNAINGEMLEELDGFLTDFVTREKVHVLLVTGSGEKAFVAGADIHEMSSLDREGMLNFCRLGKRVAFLLEFMDAVTIAAVNGYALGGGLELALACDFIYASDDATFGLPEVTLGLIPGFGGTQRLARAVGTRQAKEMILSGQPISAEEARAMGLVNRVVEGNLLLETCMELASRISRNAPEAVKQANGSINNGVDRALSDGMELENKAFGRVLDAEERIEGTKAFLEKRPPKFN